MSVEGKSQTRTLTLVTILVIVFIVADWFMGGALRMYGHNALTPVVTNVHVVISRLFRSEFWMSRASLELTVSALRDELESRKGGDAALSVLESENKILRSLARLASTQEGVTVPITSSFVSSPYGTFTIGGGSSIGINEGDVVLVGDGYVLGTVVEVSLSSALVRAMFAPGVSMDVTADSVGFILTGRGGGNARAEVPREANLMPGTPVLSAALAQRPVGVIGHVESASSSAFSDVFVSFPFNTNILRFVFVSPR